jgi:outer membrane protein TolC
LNAEVERAEQQAIEIERTLQEDVRARHRELRHGLRRLELAREGVDASLDQVRIGTIEYENGRTTAFELVRLGADLATAQERYSDALVRTAKAAAELRRLAPPDDVIRSLESER